MRCTARVIYIGSSGGDGAMDRFGGSSVLGRRAGEGGGLGLGQG
jgi:hypothetical protein